MTENQPARDDARHIRGSSLLLAGSLLSSAIDFGGQVLLVRYLSKADFGAWSYALAVVALLATVAQLEMRQAAARFLPLFEARGERGRMVGAIVVSIGVVLVVGVLLALAAVVAIGLLGLRPTTDATALGLVELLAVLIPVQALDGVFTGLFAAFGASRTIFVRQSLVAPILRFGLVVALVLTGAGIAAFAMGYVVATLLGVAIYVVGLRRVLSARPTAAGAPTRTGDPSTRTTYPLREMLRFVGPLLTSTLVWILMESSDAVLLGYFSGPEAVASFRVILPLARMNQLVATTFSVLYIPVAARAFARGDEAESRELYWRSAAWMTVLTLPVVILTLAFAPAMTTNIYGSTYASSAPILALLAGGYFFQTVTGFNGLTVKVHGHLRYMVAVDILAALVNVGVNLLLIPRFGPIGAAIGTAGTLVVHNVLKHAGLARYTSIGLVRRDVAPVYVYAFAAIVVAWLVGVWLSPGLLAALVVAGAIGLGGIYVGRAALDVDRLFPEARVIPLYRWLVGPPVVREARAVKSED